MKRGDGNAELGRYIKKHRTAQGLDFNTLATRSGLHPSYWRKLEAGHYTSPDAKYLAVMAETLDCPLADLYGLCGYTVPGQLPSLGPYLRATSDLTADDIRVIERHFESLAQQPKYRGRGAS